MNVLVRELENIMMEGGENTLRAPCVVVSATIGVAALVPFSPK